MKTKTKSLLVRITALSLVLGIAAILFSCFILYTILRALRQSHISLNPAH